VFDAAFPFLSLLFPGRAFSFLFLFETMALMRNEGKKERYANNERGYHGKKGERERRRRHKEEKKVLSSCLLSIFQALELDHSP
jgi:hypothetical protein